jgi:hypothetical protein
MKIDEESASQFGCLAALKAHHGVHFAEAYRRLGGEPRTFGPYEERWRELLVKAAVDNDRATLASYADAYAAERKRLRSQAPLPPKEVPNAAIDPDTTQPGFLRALPVLPFDTGVALPTAPSGPVRTPAPEPAKSSLPSGADLDSTVMLRSPLAAVASPGFGGQLTPTLVPEMSLDDYARLQAELRVTQNPVDVLRRAELASENSLEALRRHFFAKFQRDPNAQSEFQLRFHAHLSRLKGEEP